MSNFEPEENLCQNCGHKLQSHLKEKGGRCMGDKNENHDYHWCMANCERFWE